MSILIVHHVFDPLHLLKNLRIQFMKLKLL